MHCRAVGTGCDQLDGRGRCILALYRSAAQPTMARLGEQLSKAAARPGLVIIPTEDGYTGGERRARWAAEKAGGNVAVLPRLGHCWMLQDPGAGASALREFWGLLNYPAASLVSEDNRQG
jgi:hypothetical protein